MNSRLYSPLTGRMISADNQVPDYGYSQAYNRYAYAYNNPLKFTDPSGHFPVGFLIAGIVIGAYAGGSLYNNTWNPAEWNYSDRGTWIAMGVGAIIGGAVGTGVGASWAAGNLTVTLGTQTLSVSFANSGFVGANTIFGVVGAGGGLSITTVAAAGNINWDNVNASRNTQMARERDNALGEGMFNLNYRDQGSDAAGNMVASAYDSDYDRYSQNGKQKFPAFSTLWGNYPPDNENGTHAKPSNDGYPNQCAIRCGYALQRSGVDMSSYPRVNVTSEGYPRSSKNLADWLWNTFSRPNIYSQSEFERNQSTNTGIIYIRPFPGGTGHIDLYNGSPGNTGSGYYNGSEIWFWIID